MPRRQVMFPANRHALYEKHRYSAATRSGDLLFVSGQVGSREDGTPEPLDDTVDVTTFHTRPEEQLETVMAVRAEEIGEAPYPNWTAVGVNWLAGYDFEIKVIARVPAA